MKEITGYFRVNETQEGNFETALYKRGFAPADFVNRLIIGTYETEEEAYRAICNVLVTVEPGEPETLHGPTSYGSGQSFI
jgi:hypothetical protein